MVPENIWGMDFDFQEKYLPLEVPISLLVRLDDDTGDRNTIEESWKNFMSMADEGLLEVTT